MRSELPARRPRPIQYGMPAGILPRQSGRSPGPAGRNTAVSINGTRSGGSSTIREGSPSTNSRSIRPEDAERLLRKRLGEIATGAYRGTGVERTTLNDLFDLVVADYQETGTRSLDDVLSRLKLHLRPRLGKLRAVDFGSADIRQYKAARKAQSAEPATINRELSILKRAFSLGSRHDPPLVHQNPPIEKIPENNVRTGFLEKADYDRLLAELPSYLKLPLVLAYHTGSSLGEVMSIHHSTFSIDSGCLRVRARSQCESNGVPHSHSFFLIRMAVLGVA